MHSSTGGAIFIFILGVISLTIGLIYFSRGNITTLVSVTITLGLLLMLLGCIILAVSQQYNVAKSINLYTIKTKDGTKLTNNKSLKK